MSWNLQNYEIKKILISQILGNFVTLMQNWLAELNMKVVIFQNFLLFNEGSLGKTYFCVSVSPDSQWLSSQKTKTKNKAACFRWHIQRSVHCIQCDQLFRTIVHIKWIILEFRCYINTLRWSLQLTVLINKNETIWFPSRSLVHIFTWWKEFIVY